jgi:hypothetical protein
MIPSSQRTAEEQIRGAGGRNYGAGQELRCRFT